MDPAGNDSNDGLTPGTAFATIQFAIDTLEELDLNGFVGTIQLQAGTHTIATPISLKTAVGGQILISGDTGTPSNVLLSAVPAGTIFSGNGISANYRLEGFRAQIAGASPGDRIIESIGKRLRLELGDIIFGEAGEQIYADRSDIIVDADYEIDANTDRHLQLEGNANVDTSGRTITLTGTPAWGTDYVSCSRGGMYAAGSITYVGSATGKRYTVEVNGAIYDTGGGATYFPGNVAGTTATGGTYV